MFKRMSLFAFIFTMVIVIPATAQVPAYVPTDGLVGWWPFNGNANDESGNGHDGVVNGATLAEDRFGSADAAFVFDGINDFIDFGTDENLSVTVGSTLTISFWLFDVGYGNPLSRYDNMNTSNSNILIACGSSMPIRLTANGTNQLPSYNFTQNSWTHIIADFDGVNGTGNIYINGVLDVTGPLNFASSVSTSPFFAGMVDGPIPGHFNGSLDDIAIYNRALTEQEIQNLYTGTAPPPCVSLPSNLQQGLVGYWPFCGNANDESGNGNDGVVNGATLTEDRFGNAGAAYDFSADGAAIQTALEQSESPASSSDFTMSFWVRRDNSTILNSLLITYKTGDIGSANTSNFDIVHSHGLCPETGGIAVQNYPFNNPSSCSPDTLLNNEWYHIITHYKTVEGTFDVFKNGNFWFNGNLGSVIPGAGILTFGNNDVMDFPTQGQLDDIGIWNRALTPEEVQELYTLDACTFTVYDTLTVYETVYDTVYTYETIYDTVTTYITVTDTLLIDITFTGFEGQPSWLNTVTVFPNPASDHITIDYGNFALMAGYNTIITDAAGAMVYEGPVNSQQSIIDINAWGATGVYYMMIYDVNGVMVAVRQIVLE